MRLETGIATCSAPQPCRSAHSL